MNRVINQTLPLIIGLMFWPSTSKGALQVTNFFAFDCFNGNNPAVIFPCEGGFFGGTFVGGMGTNGNCLSFSGGTIYSLDLTGQLTTRSTFHPPQSYSPNALLVRRSDGTIWGSTTYGGTGNRGTIFTLATNNQLIVIADFGASPGYEPRDGLTLGADGELYGTTAYVGGGPYFGSGTIFKVASNSTVVTLHQFQLSDGYDPALSTADRFGNLYGITTGGGPTNESFTLGAGTVFQINTNGTFTNLFMFNGTNGHFPFVGLTLDVDGTLYGSTVFGGDEYENGLAGKGTLFRISTNKVFSTLYDFSGGADGGEPYCIMAFGADGKLYGSTTRGGAHGFGTLFRISKQGEFTTIHSFESAGYTLSVSFGSDGCLYAVKQTGYGQIMRFSIPMSPRIRSMIKTGNQIELSWDSVAGQSYQIQQASSSISTNWTNLGSSIVATNGITTATDTIQPSGNVFYRIALLP
jgi:uncharacterized repeat protein (TIGR03803 family)